MTTSKKYFLAFAAFALGILLVWGIEYLFLARFTPAGLVLPLVFLLPLYALLISRIGKANRH